MTLGFTGGNIKSLVQDMLGNDNVDTFVETWLTLAGRNLSLTSPRLLRFNTKEVVVTNTAEDVYLFSGTDSERLFDILYVTMLDDNDYEDYPLWPTTLNNIWYLEHGMNVDSVNQAPQYWAPAGLDLQAYDSQDGDDGYLGVRIFPQPTSGTYVGRKFNVSYLYMPADVDEDADISEEMSLLRKPLFESMKRYASLYTGDIASYLVARAEVASSMDILKRSFGAVPARRGVVGGG